MFHRWSHTWTDWTGLQEVEHHKRDDQDRYTLTAHYVQIRTCTECNYAQSRVAVEGRLTGKQIDMEEKD